MVVEYVIEKIPLEQPQKQHTKRFPRLPQLYLEFLENKNKLKGEFINVDYVPPVVDNVPLPPAPATPDKVMLTPIRSAPSAPMPVTPALVSECEVAPLPAPQSESMFQTPHPVPRSIPKSIPKSRPKSLPKSGGGGGGGIERKLPTLRELEEKHAIKRDKVPLQVKESPGDDEKKRNLLQQFDMLRRMYPKADIPKVSIHEDIHTLEKQYESTLFNLSLDKSVDNYKQYLTFAFMGIEWFCGKVLKIDMKGYVNQQCSQMHIYEKYLFEIGQKNYMPNKKSWPVEIQLLFAVLVQTAFFILMRNLFKSADIIKTVNEARMPPPPTNGPSVPVQPGPTKHKMRGPTIQLNDLPS